jgi:hypothetical protein
MAANILPKLDPERIYEAIRDGTRQAITGMTRHDAPVRSFYAEAEKICKGLTDDPNRVSGITLLVDMATRCPKHHDDPRVYLECVRLAVGMEPNEFEEVVKLVLGDKIVKLERAYKLYARAVGRE